VVQEVLGALRVVKAFGQEDREQDRFAAQSGRGMTARVRLAAIESGYGMVVGLTTALGTGLVVFIGVRHVQSGRITLGSLVLIMGYLTQLYEPLRTISRKAGSFQSYVASLERVFAVLVTFLMVALPLGLMLAATAGVRPGMRITSVDRKPAASARGVRELVQAGSVETGIRVRMMTASGRGIEVLRVPGGHSVLWEAYEPTGAAVAAFLGRS